MQDSQEVAAADHQHLASTVGREIVFGVIGAAIALGCILPPLVHIVTGPLGPFIGGFVAARQVKPGARGRALMAGTIGLVLAALIGAAAFGIARFSSDGPPSWFPSGDTLGLIVLGVWAYASALAFGGIVASAAFEARSGR